MPDLAAPLELLDLASGGELVTRALRWERGTYTIHPARAPEGVVVDVVRIHVPAEDKRASLGASGAAPGVAGAVEAGAQLAVPLYWDVTAGTLIPSLVGALDDVVRAGRWFKIRKYGVAPRARFTFEVFPPGVGGPAFGGVRG